MSHKKQGMIGVIVRPNENIERALKRLSKKTGSVMTEWKKANDHFTKPSDLRHMKDQELQRRREKLKRESDPSFTPRGKKKRR